LATTIVSLAARSRIEQRRRADEHRKRSEDRAEALEHVLSLYRDPLLRAAVDLQSRIYNIEARDFFAFYREGTESERTYTLDHTLYVFAEYFGWAEILRREIQFLNLGDVERTRQVRKGLDAVSETILSNEIEGSRFRIFRGHQRAIGEIMMTPPQQQGNVPSRRHETIGFAAFVDRLGDESFGRWFTDLRSDVLTMACDPDLHVKRLVLVQHALVDLFTVMDPHHVRADPGLLKRLPWPSTDRAEVPANKSRVQSGLEGE
jgi:hypothetical protein